MFPLLAPPWGGADNPRLGPPTPGVGGATPGGAGGPGAGPNGHSDAFTDFAGRDARLALHGTDDPSSIGVATAHGCVHVPNGID